MEKDGYLWVKVLALSSLLIIVMFNTACDSQNRAKPAADSIAEVNGDAISRKVFERMKANPALWEKFQSSVKHGKSGKLSLDEFAIDELINMQLFLQEAKTRSLKVDEREVDKAVIALRHQFNDLEQFGAWIQSQGLTEPELFDSLRADLLANKVKLQLEENVQVEEAVLRKFYEKNQQLWSEAGDVRLSLIAVSQRAIAQRLAQLLQSGEPFSELAKRYSQGSRAAQGGDVGWVNHQRLPAVMRGIVSSLDVGQVFGPIQRGSDFLLVKLEERRVMAAPEFHEVRQDVERIALQTARKNVVQAWLKERRARSTIVKHL
ncbi:SurA N-terminal domain-containing protein [Microbulbifer sp. SA54]|uniref:SurA N-terminal domain-containing protein n=1 Tax=Microbulbifer sp. SA54 TaxID=3401577 RepID=UPI003AAFC7C2